MKKWEYKAEYWADTWALQKNGRGESCRDDGLHVSNMIECLNEFGADGWELINEIKFSNADGYFLFKRPVSEVVE